ncbi:hypothetical protein P5673_031589 [Acropora cervicornis]|uniref:Uncharacterized protein n=1 Tax=Acropora cervicornis TaxID=6130 RepID=A0AAD9PSU6_ACRCE|nr:hypothetical protein P5673_031589 [Acropora cervicornis]
MDSLSAYAVDDLGSVQAFGDSKVVLRYQVKVPSDSSTTSVLNWYLPSLGQCGSDLSQYCTSPMLAITTMEEFRAMQLNSINTSTFLKRFGSRQGFQLVCNCDGFGMASKNGNICSRVYENPYNPSSGKTIISALRDFASPALVTYTAKFFFMTSKASFRVNFCWKGKK